MAGSGWANCYSYRPREYRSQHKFADPEVEASHAAPLGPLLLLGIPPKATPEKGDPQNSARIVCNATESIAPVIQEAGTEDLSGEDKKQWQDGLQQLKGLGMADDEAEKSLKRGFGWSSQAYWWKDKVREVPKPGEIKAKLAYLRDLGMNDDQLHEAVKHFPETVGLDLDKRMNQMKPQALGYAVDCEGDCQGDCTRCWSHF
ncbi:hypothetical protein WJX77_005113 [Trebouxia sp. C0004]